MNKRIISAALSLSFFVLLSGDVAFAQASGEGMGEAMKNMDHDKMKEHMKNMGHDKMGEGMKHMDHDKMGDGMKNSDAKPKQ